MQEIVPLGIFISTGVLWLITALQCNRVRVHFLRKLPDEAQRHVTLPGNMSPKNVTFLFREESVALLRQHADLWKLRQHTLILMTASALYPIVCMVILVIIFAFE